MNQLPDIQKTLFPNPAVYQRPDSDASTETAAEIASESRTIEAERFAEEMLNKGIFTRGELAQLFGGSIGFWRPRVNALEDKGYTLYKVGSQKPINSKIISRTDLMRIRHEDLLTINPEIAFIHLANLKGLTKNQQKTLLRVKEILF